MRTSLFYASTIGVIGAYLPFFPVWLKAIGTEAAWIGVITAMTSLARCTILPFIISFAERRGIMRRTMIFCAFATAAGFAALGFVQQPLAIALLFALIAVLWTPLGPLTDGYALKGVVLYGIDYGPMRMWGSVAFVVGALGCGALLGVVDERHLIWIIFGLAVLCAAVSLIMVPLTPVGSPVAAAPATPAARGIDLLRQRPMLAILIASALIQGSHGAYYVFGSIVWQGQGYGGFSIALLWSLGVIAEIITFAISPRFTMSPALLVIMGAATGVLRWIISAQLPSLEVQLPLQLMHGITFGFTQVGSVALLVRAVPHHLLASSQGYLVASIGITNGLVLMLSGLVYARFGLGIYYVMAGMALVGGLVMIAARKSLDAQDETANVSSS